MHMQVLKSLLHGDRAYLRNDPQLLSAAVFLHLSSHVQVSSYSASNLRIDCTCNLWRH